MCRCVQETEKLESEQAKLHDNIKAFQREKDELEFILEAHRLHCGINQPTGSTATAAAVPATTAGNEIKVESAEGKMVVVVAPISSSPSEASTTSAHLSTNSVSTIKTEEKGSAARRPNSLVSPPCLIGGKVSVSQVTGSQVAGVSITTPSAGINVYTLGLESMLDGHTGLTPITGLPVSLTTPIFAIPASVAGIPVEETTSTEVTTTSNTTSSSV